MTANLRGFVARGTPLVAPGASDALSARLIEAHGYECVYVGSYATAARRFALPDTGRLSLEQLAAHAKSIAAAVRVPMVGGAELAEVRRRVARPLMIVNNPEEEHAGASIVLYYAFSVATQFAALQRALADGKLASDTRPLEDFLGY